VDVVSGRELARRCRNGIERTGASRERAACPGYPPCWVHALSLATRPAWNQLSGRYPRTARTSSSCPHLPIRLVALGALPATVRDMQYAGSAPKRCTGVPQSPRDVPFPSRSCQIERTPGCALRLARPHLASGRFSPAPLQRGEERREKL
jgi:hypothetical protein